METATMSRIVCVFALAACFASLHVFGEEEVVAAPAVTNILQTLGRDSEHGLSLLGRDRPGAEDGKNPRRDAEEAAKMMNGLKDSQVFVKICEGEELTWGELHGEVDRLLETSLSTLTAAIGKGGGIDELRFSLYQQSISKLLQAYIRAAVVAQAAKKAGISVSAEEMAKEVEVQKSKLKSGTLSHLQMRMIDNGLHQKAYVEKFLRPRVKATDEAVAELIKRRHELNLAVPATNALLRAQLEEIRGRLVRNEIAWGEAAMEYSECVDCSDDNGDCGTWEEDEEDRGEALLKVCFSIPTNTVSEIVETEDAFHIVKIASRYVPTAKAREDDGEVSTAEVRHIQVDKWQPDPEYTEETAREFIEMRLMKRELKKVQNELIEAANIECVIPLKAGKTGQGMRKVFNRK